jgi:hypothetical protein
MSFIVEVSLYERLRFTFLVVSSELPFNSFGMVEILVGQATLVSPLTIPELPLDSFGMAEILIGAFGSSIIVTFCF